ncbi:MAG TPA: lysophospholipid acyltransferase family protein [Terriglobia bacterium]|nr:lysophospholipid acyltransferase family protein [Terriglobia bacterium]
MIRTTLTFTLTFAYIFLVGGPFLLYAVVSKRTDALYTVGVLGARLALWLAGVKIEVTGKEKIPAGRAVIFMPNHQSNSDPPAVFVHLPPVLAMAKKESFCVPVLGPSMRLRGFVPVDRQNRERAKEAVEQAVRSLKAGHSFLVFPEGTRSPDGRLQRFKKGAFLMAVKSGAAIVPVSVSGSRFIMPKGSNALRPGVIRITFHDPVAVEEFGADRLPELQARVRQAIASALTPEEQALD